MKDALKANFPIRRKVVTCGAEEEKVLYKGDTVKCPRCGKTFEANSKTAFRVGDDVYLTCPNTARTETDGYGNEKEIRCSYKFHVLYAVHGKTKENEHDGI